MTVPAPLTVAARIATVIGEVITGLVAALLAARCPKREARDG